MTDPASSRSENRRPYHMLSRREFLRIVAGIGIIGWVGGSILENLETNRVVRQTRNLMGTIVNLTLIASDRKTAASTQRAIHDCLEQMATLEAVLSRFKVDSQVSMLNLRGGLKDPHPALLELLRKSHWISELSSGLFDITILPLLTLYQKQYAREGNLPSTAEIEVACRKVDYRRMVVCKSELAFLEPGMGITLDGIAKGFIVDEGVSRLREHGFTNVLVEVGGDILAAGQPDSNHQWKIGTLSPRSGVDDLIAHLDISNEAVATSGDYMQSFTTDCSQHHILNPKTGFSSTDLSSASVIAPHLAMADALATTLMLMDPAKGMDLIRQLGMHSVMVKKNGIVLRT